MADDIVERLKYEGCDEPSCGVMRGDALREIERLRKVIEETARERDRWMTQTF